MLLLRILLFPFTLLYDLITRVRNHAYNIGSRKSVTFDLPIINVGNLSVGGTGKTPHVEYLIDFLKEDYELATLSRGYKRSTKGFRLADGQSSAVSLGDEPFQFWAKYGPAVHVAVGEDRVQAVPKILFEHEGTDIVILDDAFQHRAISPGYNILLSDYNRPFYSDWILPSGKLRESRKNANRSDVVIITKCPPEMSLKHKQEIAGKVQKYLKKGQPVYFSSIVYGDLTAVFDGNKLTERVIGLAGIANPEPFKNYLDSHFDLVDFMTFPDHHKYSDGDLKQIISKAKGSTIVCTEKDMVKLKSFERELQGQNFFYLPIKVRIHEEDAFKKDVLSFVRKKIAERS